METKTSVSTSCNCPNPPGGTVNCDAGQAAYCWLDSSRSQKRLYNAATEEPSFVYGRQGSRNGRLSGACIE